MALLSGSNLSKSFGSADIFSGVTLSVARGARIIVTDAQASSNCNINSLVERGGASIRAVCSIA